jgi:hypothetical protein
MIPGLSLLQSYFVIGFGLGVTFTLLFIFLIWIVKSL